MKAMEAVKLYVVTTECREDIGCEGHQCVVAFATEKEAKDFINQQENPYIYDIEDVPYGVQFDEKPVLWSATLKTVGRFAHIDTGCEDVVLGHDSRVGMTRMIYNALNIWFLAKNQSEADEFACRMIRSIIDREQVGWFKWLRQPVFQTNPDDVTSAITPYYDFQTGQLILPEVGRFILPEEVLKKENFRLASGKGPYWSDPEPMPLNYYNENLGQERGITSTFFRQTGEQYESGKED